MEETQPSTRGKRPREEAEETSVVKRLHADLLFEILDDVDSTSTDRIPDDTVDLETVIRSLQEEIGLPSPPSTTYDAAEDRDGDLLCAETADASSEDGVLQQLELGYLLEASDDELGLPPTVSEGDRPEDEAEPAASLAESVKNGQIWGFEDKMTSCYDAFDLGLEGHLEHNKSSSVEGHEQAGVLIQSGFFDDDYSNMLLSGQSDLSWQPEYLPAV